MTKPTFKFNAIFTFVKKWVAIVFLCIYLLSTTEIYQLLKLPTLFEHFQEHKIENLKLTFVQFVYMHYAQDNDHDGDADKDAKLPFKSHSCSSFSVNFVPLSGHQALFFNVSKEIYEKHTISDFYTFIVTASHLQAIWQPPQIS